MSKFKVGDIVIYKDETSAYHLKRFVVEEIPELLGMVYIRRLDDPTSIGMVYIRRLDDPTSKGFVDFECIEIDIAYLQQQEAKKLLGLK